MTTIRRVPLEDALRDLAGSEHTPAAREASSISQVFRAAAALDYAVRRSDESL